MSTDPRMVVNVQRLNEFMDRHRLSAVIARSGQNFSYLAGFGSPGTLARLLDLTDSPRGVMLLWPRHGEPTLVLNGAAVPVARRDSWIKQIAVYDAYVESPYAVLCDVIKKGGLERERIGGEKDYISARHWEEIQHALPHATLVECSEMMDSVRAVKTPEEIALLKRGADLLDEAYLEVFPTIRPGETEREVHSRIVYACLKRGALWAHGMLNSNRNDAPFVGERENVLHKGDVIRNDYIAYLGRLPGPSVAHGGAGQADRGTAAHLHDPARHLPPDHRPLPRRRARQRRLPVRRRRVRQAGVAERSFRSAGIPWGRGGISRSRSSPRAVTCPSRRAWCSRSSRSMATGTSKT